jgi:hypothetical protein
VHPRGIHRIAEAQHDIDHEILGAFHRTRQLPPVLMQTPAGTLVLEGLESTPCGGRVRVEHGPTLAFSPGELERQSNKLRRLPIEGSMPADRGFETGARRFDARTTKVRCLPIEGSKRAIEGSMPADRRFQDRSSSIRQAVLVTFASTAARCRPRTPDSPVLAGEGRAGITSDRRRRSGCRRDR